MDDHLLSREQAELIAKDLFGSEETLLSFERLKGGYTNAAYRLTSSSNDNGILIKSAHKKQSALLSYETNMFAHEINTSQMLLMNNVRTPKVLKYSPYGEIMEKEYAVYEYIKSDYPPNDADISLIDYKSLDTVITRFHSIKGDGFGYLSRSLYVTWYSFIVALGTELLRLAEDHMFLEDKGYTVELKAEISESRDIFEEITASYYIHNDIGKKNFLFKRSGDFYSFLALIDLERSMYGDLDFEYSRAELTDPECYKHIMLDGRQNVSANRSKRLRIYMLINLLISMHFMKVKCNAPLLMEQLTKIFIKRFKEKVPYDFGPCYPSPN